MKIGKFAKLLPLPLVCALYSLFVHADIVDEPYVPFSSSGLSLFGIVAVSLAVILAAVVILVVIILVKKNKKSKPVDTDQISEKK